MKEASEHYHIFKLADTRLVFQISSLHPLVITRYQLLFPSPLTFQP